MTYKELPFLESLLSFLEMDCGELTPALRGVAENWERLLQEDDREAGTAAMAELGQLKSRHIYLELLYVRCYDRFSRMGAGIQVSEQEDREMLEELQGLPEQLPLSQRQVQRFFDFVLDVDKAGRDPQRQASAHYSTTPPRTRPCSFFRPIPSALNRWSRAGVRRSCPPPISDMIDYSLRSCVERGITVRRCKNCGRWFPQTGRVSAEYCERPVASGQQTCREAGGLPAVDQETV